MRNMEHFDIHNFDKVIAMGGAIFFCLIAIYFIFQTSLIYLIMSLFGLGSCILWLFIRNKKNLLSYIVGINESNNKNIFYCLFIIYLLLFVISILIILTRQDVYVRPLSYFIIISIMSSIVGLEIIFSTKKHQTYILLQIILIGVSLYLTQVSLFPGVVGVDPWFHQMFSSKMINEGYIPGGSSYSQLPIFHLLVSITTIITNLSYKYSSILSIGFLQLIVNIMVIFLFGKYLFNEKVGLLSGLLLTTANYHVFMGSRPISNTIACVIILLILYILIVLRKTKPIKYTFLLLMLMLVLIMTHTVASMGLAIILLVCWGVSIMYKHENVRISRYISFSLLTFFIVAMFGWWIYASGHITTLAKLIKWGFSIDIFNKTPLEIMSYYTRVPFQEILFSNMSLILFFSFSIIGCLFMLSDKAGKKKHDSFLFACIGLTPLIVGFFSLISGHAVIEERWWYLAQILLAIPVGLAIILICSITNKKVPKVFILCGSIFVLTFIMILNPNANIDNNMFMNNSSSRNAVYDSELQSLKTISSVWDGAIGGDGYFSNTVMQYLGYRYKCIDDMLWDEDFNNCDDCIILVREAIIDKPFQLYNSSYQLKYNPKTMLDQSAFVKIYDCNTVTGYQQGVMN